MNGFMITYIYKNHKKSSFIMKELRLKKAIAVVHREGKGVVIKNRI